MKFFITNLQKRRELYFLSFVWLLVSFLFFTQNSSRKGKCRRQMSLSEHSDQKGPGGGD
jgi:hypothetical protein